MNKPTTISPASSKEPTSTRVSDLKSQLMLSMDKLSMKIDLTSYKVSLFAILGFMLNIVH